MIIAFDNQTLEFREAGLKERLIRAIEENLDWLKKYNIKAGRNAIWQIHFRERMYRETIRELKEM